MGWLHSSPDPSTFGLHPNTPGVTYLHSSAALAVRSLAAAFGEHACDTIKLRRVEAHGLCVPFHTDYSRYCSRWICRVSKYE